MATEQKELIDRGIERIIPLENSYVCRFFTNLPLNDIFYYFLLPLLVLIVLLLIYIYRDKIKEFITSLYSKAGYVKIMMILDNKNITHKYKKLDKFNIFKFKKKRYNLDKMNEFIIGYEENMPVFLYNLRFVFPLSITEKYLNNEVKNQIKDKEILKETVLENKIKALILKIDSSILNLVYDKKLLSDLYSISAGDSELKNKIFWALIISVGLVIAYYTGLLDKVLEYLT